MLTRWFGTISFGDLAVDGFFIISGLLISASFLGSNSVWNYLLKRVGRIYPAFIVASLICVLVFAPLGGATEGSLVTRTVHTLARSLILTKPYHYGAFAGLHYQDLDGSMWTIPYEFRCYLLVILFGLAGLLDNAFVLAVLSLACLVSAVFFPADAGALVMLHPHPHTDAWLGEPGKALRLTGMFMAGAAFRAFQHRIPFRPALMAISGFAIIALLFTHVTADIGVAIFGSYLIFGAAALGTGTLFERINNKNDISYGVYLYAYPIENLLIYLGFTASLLLTGLLTLAGALAFGFASWFALERPVMRLVRSPPTRSRHTVERVED